MGHEFSGVVVEKGSEVGAEVGIGDRVTGEPSIDICGRCDYCRSGHYNMCPSRTVMGYWHDGCFAPFVNATPRASAAGWRELRGGGPHRAARLLRALRDRAGRCHRGGSGRRHRPRPRGASSAPWWRPPKAAPSSSAAPPATVDRLRFAQHELGIARVLDVDADDAAGRIAELGGGYGADVVIECAGAAAAIDLALEAVRKRGKVSLMGLPGRRVEVDFEKIAYKELRVSGGIGQRRTAWERALKLMASGRSRQREADLPPAAAGGVAPRFRDDGTAGGPQTVARPPS